jgi:diketogulonate reductase-like aldo/keto reductase
MVSFMLMICVWKVANCAIQGFIPLPKSVTPSRIEENADVYNFELTGKDMKTLDTGVYEPCAWDPTKSDD